MSESTRYVQVCTELVDGICQATAWAPWPGESQYTIEQALSISAAIAALWGAAWVFRPLANSLQTLIR